MLIVMFEIVFFCLGQLLGFVGRRIYVCPGSALLQSVQSGTFIDIARLCTEQLCFVLEHLDVDVFTD